MSASSLKIGQRFRVNSFDLGFINLLPIDLLLEVRSVDGEELLLAPLPTPGQEPCPSLIRIARWFHEEYPKKSKDTCMLKNASAFQKMIDCGAAILQQSQQDTHSPLTLLTNIQQQLYWPSLRPDREDLQSSPRE